MDYIYTFLLSITPVIELRGAIPIAYLHFDLGIIPATFIGILGGLCIVVFCLTMLPLLFTFMDQIPVLKKPKDALLEKTRTRHSEKMRLWGEVFLVIMVSIPLPGSGAFTGSTLAYLFGIPARHAFWLISTGTIISAILVAGLTVSGKGLWGFLASL